MSIARLYPTGTALHRFTGHTPRRSDAAGIESLTSFLCQISFKHYCAPHRLYGALVTNKWDKGSTTLGKIRSSESQLINSFGKIAKTSSEALKKESGILNAEEMTFLCISDLCDSRAKHFLHKVRHWCAQCYMESRQAKEPAWDPLYWAPTTTTICLAHKTLLQKICPHCERTQRHLPKFPFLDFCEYCGFDLATSAAITCDPAESRQRLWLANAALDLLKNRHHIMLSRENFSLRLNEAMNICSNGTFEDFARTIGISTCNLRNWQLKSAAPTWSNFIDISYRLNTPAIQLAGPGSLIFDPSNLNYKTTLRLDKQHRHLPKEKLDEVRKVITELLNAPIDIWVLRRENITSILKQFDICYWTFKRNLGDLADAISKKHEEANKFRKGLTVAGRIKRLHSAHSKLAEMDLTPSVRNLKKSGMVKVSDVIPLRRG